MHIFKVAAILTILDLLALTSSTPREYFLLSRTQSFLESASLSNAPFLYRWNSFCSDTKGQINEMFMESKIYHASVKYSVYLPPCFDDHSTPGYPVVYLLHGQTYNNEQWSHLGIAAVTDKLINTKQIPSLIIIMPNDPDWRQPNESPFGRMIVEEMINHIDNILPTRADRQYRAIGGLSRGASWALHLGLTEWNLFSRIGAHSLPIFINDENDIKDWFDSIPSNSIPQLFIDTGNQDPELNKARNFEKLLSTRNIPHEWHMYTGMHEEEYWVAHIEKYLLWYVCDWKVLLYN